MAKHLVVCHDGTDPHAVSELVRAENDEEFSTLFPGFIAELTAAEVTLLRADERVQLVEELTTPQLHLIRTPARGGTRWYLEAMNAWPLRGQGKMNYTGAGVHVYVVDSGVDVDNSEFGGRASQDFSAFTSESQLDGYGHGTAVAGIIGGVTRGLAPGVTLHSVKVFDRTGHSSDDTAIYAGMEWLAKNALRPAVVNMSLGGLGGVGINLAVAKLTSLGITVVVSAGNERADAINYAPASEATAITVGGYDVHRRIYDVGTDGTNYGRAVDVMAPAVGIDSLRLGTTRGTSFAAPCVTALVARFIEAYGDLGPTVISDWLKRHGDRAGIPDPLTDFRPPIALAAGL